MVPGVGGRLVSHSFLEQHLLPSLDESVHAADIADLARGLTRWWRVVLRTLGPASSARPVFDVAVGPLLALLGYPAVSLAPQPWGLAGVLRAGGRADVVTLILPWPARVDAAWRDAVRGGVVSDARWALVSNGHALRLIDCAKPWTRLAIEFDLGAVVTDPRGAPVLWALARADAIAAADADPTSLSAVIAASGRHAARVCRSLGDGVLDALPDLAAALEAPRAPGRRGPAAHAFHQALTIVYRVLFLLFAEARGLVPIWNEVYREGYTIDALCRRIAERPAAPGLWSALQAISRMAHAGCRAGDLDVTAFNGRLFSPAYAPLVERRRVPDAVVRRMVLALATTDGAAGRHRIGYHDLGVEELGSVYERVLDREPSPGATAPGLSRGTTARKATGSFYTPRAITEFLVRRTLQPLTEGRTADEILSLRVVDPAMGSGAFLVAACLYLADQGERAMVRDGRWQAADITAADRASLRRQVAERCLYGVDLNPTAVQLARLSLWLTTLAADRPLTFLDHHLATGNSLLGASLADLARPPLARDRARPAASVAPRLPLFEDEMAATLAGRVLPERVRLALDSSDTLDAVRRKERRLSALTAPGGPFAAWMRAAHAWCAIALWPGAPPSGGLAGEMLAAAMGGPTTLGRQVERWLTRAEEIAQGESVFHWPLAFPEVFFDETGRPRADAGFDAVIGNPPWDVVRSTSHLRFFRGSGLYRHQGRGHPNRYQLFLERAWHLTRPGGRFGIILPSGLASDQGSAALRRRLLDRCEVDTWVGFDNRQGIFPIHRSVRFVLLAATQAGSTDRLRMSCGLHDTAALDRRASLASEDGDTDAIVISRARLEAWDPDSLTIPEVTSPVALAVATQAADAAPPLGAAHGWHARFGRELNATDDREHFRAAGAGGDDAIPILEGKHVSPFRVSVADATQVIPRGVAARLIDPAISFDRVRLAYREVASATNRLTLIAALLPRRTLTTHTVFCLKAPLPPRAQWCLLALLNSLVANFLVRLRVTTHVTAALMATLPVPRPLPDSRAFRELASLAMRLSRRGPDAAPAAYARLNAIVATLYDLTPDQYAHVVESFPLLPESLRLECIAAHIRATETRRHGEDK